MQTTLRIKNYRCFVRPARVDIGNAFTAFIGVNNAGKSTIMRFLFECRDIFRCIKPGDKKFQQSLHSPQSFAPNQVVDKDEIFSNLNNSGLEFSLEFQHDENAPSTALTKVTFYVTRDLLWRTEIAVASGHVDANPSRSLQWSQTSISTSSGGVLVDLGDLYAIASDLANAVYIGSFRNAINLESKTKYLDIAVGAAFIGEFGALRAGNSKANSESFNRLVDDIQRIFGFQKLTIEPSSDQKSLHFNVNGRAYKQHELGSGLLQFVVVLGSVLIKKPAYILIDEPELGLHPKLQLDFLTTLASYSTSGVWFSTHSIGLARSAASRIYAVSSATPGDSVVQLFESHPSLSEFLGEMSFSAHKDVGFEKILLVEGPTDVVAFQQILRKLGKDHKIMLLALHGRMNGKMGTELEEIKRACTNISAIIDSEKSASGDAVSTKRLDFQRLCESSGIECHILERRATENYFAERVIRQVFGPSYRALTEFERLEQLPLRWAKDQNWKLAMEMSLDEWKKNDLGIFLDRL